MKTRYGFVLASFTLAPCAFFIWPTPYVYTQKQGTVWRVNRFTGIREQSTPKGWRSDVEIRKEADEVKRRNEQAERSRQEQMRAELQKGVTVDYDTSHANRLVLHNASDLEATSLIDENVIVEWYTQGKDGEELSVHFNKTLTHLARNEYCDIDVTPDYDHVDAYTAMWSQKKGTTLVQKVRIRMETINSSAGQLETNLTPPVELTFRLEYAIK